ncbi:MAG TPA: winged helix DNA-binding domain-containing protein [Gaiellaceae bacterium]|nr:winged helix DNA-binding domain-containing protein [Gaiellaceae bacterium]
MNRTLLLRQMLLERKPVSPMKAVTRLVALQAQYAPSPYVALWSRIEEFRKEQLTRALAAGTIVNAGTLRGTLHVMSGAEYPHIASSYIESRRGRSEGLGVDLDALRAAVPEDAFSSAELAELARRVLGTDDQWTVAFALRAVPFVRSDPVGPWPHTKPPPYMLWREPLPDAMESSVRVVRQYLAAYGPATRDDIEQYTGFKVRQIAPALEGLRTLADEEGRTLYDVPRAPYADGQAKAPVRFLPAFDSVILAHRDRSRIVPPEYAETVFNKKNAMTKNTFTVDGFVAGAWRIEKGKLVVEPFARLPLKWQREVDAEGERLLAWYLG